MKTESSSYSVSELESKFAEDFKTPIFPILAKYYLDKSLIHKALKVSNIGLDKNSQNYSGKYILSQIYIINNELMNAEKLLMSVVKYQSCNMKAMIALIKLKISLGRSNNIIKSYIDRAFTSFPYNLEIIKMHKSYFLDIDKSNKDSNFVDNVQLDNKQLTSFSVDAKLATKSLYRVFIAQKKYIEAQKILSVMSKNKNNKKFINVENKKVLELINKKGK